MSQPVLPPTDPLHSVEVWAAKRTPSQIQQIENGIAHARRRLDQDGLTPVPPGSTKRKQQDGAAR